MKRTPQRLAVMEYLANNPQHPSIMDIHRAVAEKFSTISIATIYSIMETLKKEGQIKDLSIDPRKKRFDTNLTPHDHQICTTCGKIFDVSGTLDSSFLPKGQDKFLINDRQAIFYGTCMSCQTNPGIVKMESSHEAPPLDK